MRFPAACCSRSRSPSAPAHAFCGFFVGKADAQLFNQSSQVVLVRDGERTVLTHGQRLQGRAERVRAGRPGARRVLKREQIHVGDRKLLERLDAYSAPRLVEYYDADPCDGPRVQASDGRATAPPPLGGHGETRARREGARRHRRGRVHRRRVRHRHPLRDSSPRASRPGCARAATSIPNGASAALQPYIKQDMKFFVAKVNLKEQASTGFSYLRPHPDCLRVDEVHAPHPPRHGERRRPAGPDHLRAHPPRARRVHQLPDGEDALRRGRPRSS